MDPIRVFSDIGKDDTALAGGKGASLGEMTQAGIPVPAGFVITTTVFEHFLDEANLLAEIDSILHTVNKEEMHTIEHASERIQQLILGTEMPADIAKEIKEYFDTLGTPYVAVRSSATAEDGASAAWAGQLDSYLNTTKETFLSNVQRCWASLFTPRAIFYRFEKELHTQKISVAVVVQKMVASEVSGIAFSVHPVTEDRNQIIIEAGYGLGEAIVSGKITPDSYVIEKKPRRVVSANVKTQYKGLFRSDNGGNKWQDIQEPGASSQKITDEQILELSDLIVRIESHSGHACDIEWALENGKFYIVQSRPITTLNLNRNAIQELGTSNDWLRLFRVQGLRYFIDDIWMEHYKTLDALVTVIDGEYVSYLPENVHTRTRKAGAEMITQTGTYEEYESQFRAYMKEIDALTNSFPFSNATVAETKKLLDCIARLFVFYSKTEFFYTDGAYEAYEKSHDPEVKLRITRLGDLKNEGRALLNAIFFGADAVLPKLLRSIERRFGVSERTLQQYSREELYALFDGVRVPEEVIAKRENAFYMRGFGGVLEVQIGIPARRAIEAFQREALREGLEEIKGVAAHTGTVRGSARVIRSGYDNFDALSHLMDAMKKGDILVAETTSPELMPACQKAGGIVTDQGGMLSHAAIVSRELSIPCIVSATDATDIIHDGDLVEVNGDKGIVYIVERAQR